MKSRLLIGLGTLALLAGCSSHSSKDFSLDPGIPRVETPNSQIAYIRTKWMNEKHVETAYLDSRDRVLEVFRFNRSSSKTLHRYEGAMNTITIHYNHSDSSPLGNVAIDTLRREYDIKGRVVAELHTYGSIPQSGKSDSKAYYNRYLDYTAKGDTIVRKVESSYDTTNSSTVVNIDRWEQDDKKSDKRHYRLYVMQTYDNSHDTLDHYSQRFAYDSNGRLALAWFDYMHLGRFYMPAGPDTISYEYDSKNRLVSEHHHYTTDMRNKSEFDTTRRNDFEKESLDWYRKKFFVGDKYFPNNQRIDRVTYQYEVFDPEKHLPLKIPAN